jgi:hypothetical protein
MSIFLTRWPLRMATVCCLMVFQGHLLWLATSHQHPLVALARAASTAFSQGSLASPSGVASELSCGLCQMVRHSQALLMIGSPALRATVSVSSPPFFSPEVYHSRQAIVLFGRAPPLS